jgi:hypothetical protein
VNAKPTEEFVGHVMLRNRRISLDEAWRDDLLSRDSLPGVLGDPRGVPEIAMLHVYASSAKSAKRYRVCDCSCRGSWRGSDEGSGEGK